MATNHHQSGGGDSWAAETGGLQRAMKSFATIGDEAGYWTTYTNLSKCMATKKVHNKARFKLVHINQQAQIVTQRQSSSSSKQVLNQMQNKHSKQVINAILILDTN